ncbi:hypothetical protein P3T25_002997 [Paraburkholderia sp. GAS32]
MRDSDFHVRGRQRKTDPKVRSLYYATTSFGTLSSGTKRMRSVSGSKL